MYKLDFNHSPDFYKSSDSFNARLRSGNEYSISKLNELNSFFAKEFGFLYASYTDFSPYSIAQFLKANLPENEKLAYSSKLGFFCEQAVQILKSFGVYCVEISANKDGSFCKNSILKAKEQGAEYFFTSLIDDDIFYKNSLEEFEINKTILDISNSVKKCEIPNGYFAGILHGYKLGSLKASGIFLSNQIQDFNLQDIDLFGYSHLESAYLAYKIDKNLKNIFTQKLQDTLKDSIYFYANSDLDNGVCIGFKNIIARDFIRTLAIDGIFVTNGELCSLGLSRPSNIIQKLGYSEMEARNAISFSFKNLEQKDIEFLATRIAFKYKQLIAING